MKRKTVTVFAAALLLTISGAAAQELTVLSASESNATVRVPAEEAAVSSQSEAMPVPTEPAPQAAAESAAVFSSSPTNAEQRDDIMKAIAEAMRQYRTDDLSGAVSNLDYASQLIRQKKSERMKTLLPAALPGWQANEATAQILGAAVFGGGASVSRDYISGQGESVSVEIVSDSPVLQSIIMMLNNPLFAVGNVDTVKGQRAMIKYDTKDRSGEINVVASGRFIVTVKGRQIDQPALLRYAEAVDFEALAKK